ncbi:DUF2946 family protein [Parasphingorhabdus cellanae]|uniref:DUF2946 domain-containing protein n=1 Tax=Parasphingorhabdus cellanae TaxID=2806553 RepID=A0ABX7T8Z2_9SPHN|nr:DUF2946 family protein [Parasphingorhabdus cellanae]QTD56682.1 hypothetical protein J4G78_03620 [Parasphingorhabdus cellanae]
MGLRLTVWINSGSRPLSILYSLAMLAILLTALVPQGFMPAQTANGFSIQLCSGHENSKLAITSEHPDYAMLAMVYGGPEQPESPAPESESPICTYAAASSASLLASAPAIALVDRISASHQPETRSHFAVRNRINIPPATGPPVIV